MNGNPTLNSIPFPNNQSSIITDQFSQLTVELKIFTKLVSNNLSEMTQVLKTTQEQTGKFIEKALSQALTKTQDTTVPTSATLNTNTPNVTYTSLPYNLHQTPTWHVTHPNTAHAANGTTHPAYGYQEVQTPTRANSSEQQIYQANTNLNQSVVALLRYKQI